MPADLMSPVLASVRETKGAHISAEKLAKRLHMTLGELAALVGVHRNTLSRSSQSADVQKTLVEIVRILDWAAAIASGDENLAVYWFKYQALVGFDKQTAADLVREGHATAVFAVLEMIENGVPA